MRKETGHPLRYSLYQNWCPVMVPMAGVEPARYCYQRILSPSRLPIPSHRPVQVTLYKKPSRFARTKFHRRLDRSLSRPPCPGRPAQAFQSLCSRSRKRTIQSGQIGQGVDRGTADPYLKVAVDAGRAPGTARLSDLLALVHLSLIHI